MDDKKQNIQTKSRQHNADIKSKLTVHEHQQHKNKHSLHPEKNKTNILANCNIGETIRPENFLWESLGVLVGHVFHLEKVTRKFS